MVELDLMGDFKFSRAHDCCSCLVECLRNRADMGRGELIVSNEVNSAFYARRPPLQPERGQMQDHESSKDDGHDDAGDAVVTDSMSKKSFKENIEEPAARKSLAKGSGGD